MVESRETENDRVVVRSIRTAHGVVDIGNDTDRDISVRTLGDDIRAMVWLDGVVDLVTPAVLPVSDMEMELVKVRGCVSLFEADSFIEGDADHEVEDDMRSEADGDTTDGTEAVARPDGVIDIVLTGMATLIDAVAVHFNDNDPSVLLRWAVLLMLVDTVALSVSRRPHDAPPYPLWHTHQHPGNTPCTLTVCVALQSGPRAQIRVPHEAPM